MNVRPLILLVAAILVAGALASFAVAQLARLEPLQPAAMEAVLLSPLADKQREEIRALQQLEPAQALALKIEELAGIQR